MFCFYFSLGVRRSDASNIFFYNFPNYMIYSIFNNLLFRLSTNNGFNVIFLRKNLVCNNIFVTFAT